MCLNKNYSIIVASLIICASVASIVIINNAPGPDYDEGAVTNIIQEKMDEIVEDFDNTLGKEYGISYAEYCTIMEALAGKALVLTGEGDNISASLQSPIEAGSLNAEVHGKYIYLYLDSITTNMILGGGAAAAGIAIGAVLGSVVPVIGNILAGTAGAILMAAIEAAIVALVIEGLNIENGVVVIIQYMDTYKVFGISFDFICNLKPHFC